MKQFLQNIYGFGDWVKTYGDAQIFLNRELIFEKYLSLEEVQQQAADFMLRFDGVQKAVTGRTLENNEFDNGVLACLQKGFNQKRSADVFLVLDPAWIEYSHTGTTHGSGYTYDRHVPLIWYGWNVKAGIQEIKLLLLILQVRFQVFWASVFLVVQKQTLFQFLLTNKEYHTIACVVHTQKGLVVYDI